MTDNVKKMAALLSKLTPEQLEEVKEHAEKLLLFDLKGAGHD